MNALGKYNVIGWDSPIVKLLHFIRCDQATAVGFVFIGTRIPVERSYTSEINPTAKV
jgi:hypothetical protein